MSDFYGETDGIQEVDARFRPRYTKDFSRLSLRTIPARPVLMARRAMRVLGLGESTERFIRCVPGSWISASVAGNGITGLNTPVNRRQEVFLNLQGHKNCQGLAIRTCSINT
jgi:hypothetical protein